MSRDYSSGIQSMIMIMMMTMMMIWIDGDDNNDNLHYKVMIEVYK